MVGFAKQIWPEGPLTGGGMNIILFGFMGTGKSAVAQALARRLNLKWVDMDRIIESREGVRVTEIFEKKGESYFRSKERSLVQEIMGQDQMVVSTGGGVVLDRQNIEDLSKRGLAICLFASVQAIFERTRHRQDRPLLKGEDPMKKIRELLELRRPYYQAIPHQIDTTGKSVHDVVEAILSLVEEYRKEAK